jgi:hypothetical protein
MTHLVKFTNENLLIKGDFTLLFTSNLDIFCGDTIIVQDASRGEKYYTVFEIIEHPSIKKNNFLILLIEN